MIYFLNFSLHFRGALEFDFLVWRFAAFHFLPHLIIVTPYCECGCYVIYSGYHQDIEKCSMRPLQVSIEIQQTS